MTRISLDSPCYFITSVTHHRLPVFRTDKFKDLMCTALDEARTSSEMLLFAYVIMLDHFHIITDGRRKISDTLRYLNGISARRLVDHLKANGPEESLRKLQLEEKAANYKYSLWEHHSDKFLLTSESMFMQMVNYIHNNPVAEGLVERPEDYKYSSVRYWLRKPLLDEEPLEMDLKQIHWYST
ncbi:MAG: transposase [Pyrinomonadaceae bacterium]